MKKILFVCSANITRSKTAQKLFAKCKNFETRSAGTNAFAGGIQISQQLIDWAEIIFAMHEKHEEHISFIINNFSVPKKTLIYDLNIPNSYIYDEPALKELVFERVSQHIKIPSSCRDILLASIK